MRHQTADAAIGVDAKGPFLHANPERRLPVPLSQPPNFVRDVPQRGEDQAPGKLRGRVRRSEASRRDYHAVRGAGSDIDVSRAAPGLTEEPELGQTFDQRAWHRRA